MPRKKAGNEADRLQALAAKAGFGSVTHPKTGKVSLVERYMTDPSDTELLRAIGFEPPVQPARYYIQVWCEEHVEGAPSEVRGRRLMMTLNGHEMLSMIGRYVAERLGVELPRVQRIVKSD
jgi:hypothetical protein